jgi:hypothetical protein
VKTPFALALAFEKVEGENLEKLDVERLQCYKFLPLFIADNRKKKLAHALI